MSTPRARPPIPAWMAGYRRQDLAADAAAGLTVGAMLVPQAMAYALVAGLPPEVGLYAAGIPVAIYALLGTSRQLSVGPVAIVSLLAASALGALAAEGTVAYVEAAAVLAILVGLVHLVVAAARLGFLIDFLSHAVLVGFAAAAAIIIGFSQVKHVLGISVERTEHFHQTVLAVAENLSSANGATVAVGTASLAALAGLKRFAPTVPGALVVVVGSILANELFNLTGQGVAVVGDIPGNLPLVSLPSFELSLLVSLSGAAVAITVVGYMESMAVAKVYARRHGYEIKANRELVGLGSANLAAGFFGGYPVTGGFSRTAVNDTAGARSQLASLISAGIVLVTVAFLTPLLSGLPNAALGAIIIMAVVSLVDVAEMRHIARVKPSDLIALITALLATLFLGIEIGILLAVVVSMLVVFARMSTPHVAILGRVPQTTTYRNARRFAEVGTADGVRIVRIDAAVTFVNAAAVRRLILDNAELAAGSGDNPVLILDASGINDLDATGADMLSDVIAGLDDLDVRFHISNVKGPVRDVLHRAGLWERLTNRLHASTHDAVTAVTGNQPGPSDHRRYGIDEHPTSPPDSPSNSPRNSPGQPSANGSPPTGLSTGNESEN